MYYKEGLLLFKHSDVLNLSIINCSVHEKDALVMLESLKLVVNEYGEGEEVTKSSLTLSGVFERDMLFHMEASAIEKDLWDYLGESLYKYEENGIKIFSDTMVSINDLTEDGCIIRKAKFSKSDHSEYFMDMEFALELFKAKK